MRLIYFDKKRIIPWVTQKTDGRTEIMKKMLLTVIFIIVLALLVLAGCVSFSTNIPGMNEAQSEEPATESRQPVTYYIPATDEAGEQMTDVEGSQVYVPVAIDEPDTVNEEDTGHYYEPYSSDSHTNGEQSTETRGTASQQDVTSATRGNQTDNSTTKNDQQSTTRRNQSDTSTTKNNQQSSTPTTRRNQTDATTTRNNQQEQSTTSAHTPQTLNEYDIFRSGTFYASGSMRDSEGVSPLKMAITPNTIYMLTKFESVDMAILVSDGTTFLIYPDAKAYLEVNSVVMKLMGLNTDDLISSSDLGFGDLKSLSDASRNSKTQFNGTSCTMYEFDNTDGSVCKVYMNGNRLLAIETWVNGAVTNATYIDSLTSVVPADMQKPNPAYEKKSIFDFMSLLTNVIE